MGLPTFQSVVTCAPNRYCLMSSGLVSASHTLDTGELRLVVALAMNPLFVILKPPVNTSCFMEGSGAALIRRSSYYSHAPTATPAIYQDALDDGHKKPQE